MPFYSLLTDPPKTVSTPAEDRAHALVLLGRALGLTLTFADDVPSLATYLLDEWPERENPHWVNHHIPVFVVAKS